jgi:putative sterol carrier protein
VTVAHRRAHADAVVRVDGELLDRIVTGKANALTAMLRGDMTVEGDHELMVYFQRLLPAPPGARGS